MTAALCGWLAASCQSHVDEKRPFEPWGGYARAAVHCHNSLEVDSVPRMIGRPCDGNGNYRPVWAGAPLVRHFGLYDAEENGH
jgi:hypothetical protein